MRKLDELEIINILQNAFGNKQKFVPDDIEILKMSGSNFVAKSDMLVQSTDVPPGMKLEDIARKSIVSCVSDLACKGIRPRYAIISLALPSDFTRMKVKKIAKGFALASREFGIKIVGGDVNEGKEIIIDVSMFGLGKKIPRRGGAKNRDIIITSGPFGYSSSGLEIVLHHRNASKRFIKKCRRLLFKPMPKLEFGLRAGKYFNSSMDSSDGLATTLNDMSEQSKKKFVIKRIPSLEDVSEFAKKNRMDFLDLVFCGGEEYEIVATVAPNNLEKVRKAAKTSGISYFEIGHVTNGRDVFLMNNRRKRLVKRCGWVHFRS